MVLLERVGNGVLAGWSAASSFMRLTSESLAGVFRPPFRVGDIVRQIHYMAVESAPVVIFCLCFAAVVTIIEASFHMKLVVQDDSLVPGFAALLIIRELGAVVSALLVTSRVGAGLAAEVGTMKITEQIDALRMLGINPIRYLVVPRLIAFTIGGAMLSVIANVVCLYAAAIVSQMKLNQPIAVFLVGMRTFVDFQDLIFAAIKGAVFGAVVPLFSCYFGFRCRAGAEGVGMATTNSVVATSIAVIILDFILSWFFSYFY